MLKPSSMKARHPKPGDFQNNESEKDADARSIL